MFRKIAIVGTGNVAQWLKQVLTISNFEVIQISGRAVHQSLKDADLFIFALKDAVYEEVLKKMPFKMNFAVHTAGVLSQDILKPYSENYGVLYPYQSIACTKDNNLYANNLQVPVCVEGNTGENGEHLFAFAEQWSEKVFKVNGEQRLSMHVAAVFASNFTNALYGIAYQIFEQQNIDWEMIFPLLQHTLEKAKQGNPVQLQTGPAIRGDMETIQKHLQFIKRNDWQEVYKGMTEFIS